MAIAEAAADATKTGNEDWSLNHLHMPQKQKNCCAGEIRHSSFFV